MSPLFPLIAGEKFKSLERNVILQLEENEMSLKEARESLLIE